MKLAARYTVALLAAWRILTDSITDAQANVVYRTVAVSGTQAAGAPAGVNYSFFNFLRLDASGRTVFAAGLAGGGVTAANDSGVWSEGSGTLALVAREGSPAPGLAGVNFASFGIGDRPVINGVGRVAFRHVFALGGTITANNNESIWSQGSTGTLALVVRDGSQAPGVPDGAVFGGTQSLQDPVFNDSGRTAFEAFLQTTGGGVDSTNDNGIWSEGSGTLALVAREGSQAPGTPAGANFNGFSDPVLNGAGKTAFIGTLQTTGGGVDSTNNSGIWSEGGGSLALVAREGSAAPGAAGANFDSFQAPVINDTGQTAFSAILQIGGAVTNFNETGIWSGGAGTLSLVAREGAQAPGLPPGAAFNFFDSPRINAAGQTVFRAGLAIGAGGVTFNSDETVWSEGSGSLALVAQEGDQAPGTPLGVVFSFFFGTNVTINSPGAVAFGAVLTGTGVTTSNDVGLWAEGPTGLLTLVAREGDLFQIAPTDSRTILSVGLAGVSSGGEDGRGMTFNDDYTVVFSASFTDGSSGVFTAILAVPEARQWLMLAAVAAAMLGAQAVRRRQAMAA